MKNGRLIARTRYSLAGLADAWRRERSFRAHLGFSATLVGVAVWAQPGPVWWAVLILALAIGLAFEAMNGAIEALADLVEPRRDPRVRVIKDMASAAAFLVNCATGVLGAIIISLAW
jgi:diacylglycerol kinase